MYTARAGRPQKLRKKSAGESQNEITKDGERVARSQIKLHCSNCRQSGHNSRRCPNYPSLAEKLNNPRRRVRSKRQQPVEQVNNQRRRVRSKRQQPVENTTIDPNVEQVTNQRRRVTSEQPKPVENTTEPPVEQTADPSVYIPVPLETHDIFTQEDIDFEMALSSFNFDELTVPMQNPNVIPEQATLVTEPDDVQVESPLEGPDEGHEELEDVQVEPDQFEIESPVEGHEEPDQVELEGNEEPEQFQVAPPPSQKKKPRVKLQVKRNYRTRSSNVMKFSNTSKEPIDIE
nr:uncharacterized protein LOC109163970 [Ipomoea batatas]